MAISVFRFQSTFNEGSVWQFLVCFQVRGVSRGGQGAKGGQIAPKPQKTIGKHFLGNPQKAPWPGKFRDDSFCANQHAGHYYIESPCSIPAF